MVANDAAEHGHDQPRRARPGVQVQARRPAREHRPGEQPAEGRGHEAAPGHGRVLLRLVRPEQAARDEAEPVLQAVVAGLRSLTGYPDEITQSFGLTVEAQITAIENGQADWTLEAPPADRLERDRARSTRARCTSTPLTAFWYAPMNIKSRAVQQPEGAAGGQLRDRPQRRRQDLRRPEARDAVVPGAAARLPGLQGLLPVHEEPGHDAGRRPTSRRRRRSSRRRAQPGRRSRS